MVIKQYDVSLVRLRHEHIEEVRQWRNSEKIKSRMEFREQITPDMQEKWFERINNIEEYLYLLMQVNGKNIGLFHTKGFATNETEAGMFMWDDDYLNTPIPVVVSLIMSDWNFYLLGNTHASVRMLKSNRQAIAYNINFGFRLCDGEEQQENQLYISRKDDYELFAPSARSRLRKLYRNRDDTIILGFEKEDNTNGVTALMEKFFIKNQHLPSPVRFQFEQIQG